jgi:MFS family permease
VNLLALVHAMMFLPFVAIVGTRVLFSLYALDLGASPIDVGLLNTATQFASLLTSYPAGLLQDRFGARWLLVLTALLGGASLLLPVFQRDMAALYAACTLCGVWSAFVIVLTQTLVGTLSRPGELARNFSHYTVLAWGTQLCGPLIAGYSIDAFGHARACLVFIPIALLALALPAIAGSGLPGGTGRGGSAPKFRAAFANRRIVGVLIASSSVQLAMEMFPFFLPLFGHANGFAASSIGWLMATSAGAGMLLCLVLPRIAARHSEEQLLGWCFMLSAAAFALMPWLHSPALLGTACALFGIGMGAGQPLSAMLMFKHSPAGQAGAGMGLRMVTNSATRVLGPPAMGWLAASAGLASAPLLTAALLAASAWGVRPGRVGR